jgi:hypothetical protein
MNTQNGTFDIEKLRRLLLGDSQEEVNIEAKDDVSGSECENDVFEVDF